MSVTIDILCATDDSFAPYCGIMLTSVFANNKNNECRVFIFVGGSLKKKTISRFIKLEQEYGQKISFITVDMSLFDKRLLIHEDDHVSIATFYRLLAGELLPKSVSRVLYLDGDIIVTGDLSRLWGIDLTDKAVAAVNNAVLSQTDPKRLCYPIEAGYFNAGVLLLNLDYWREKEVGRKCIDFLKSHHDILMFQDQDVLNAVLWNEKRFIPMTYNFLVYLLKDVYFNKIPLDIQKEILDTSKNPCIIHYASAVKPWSVVYYNLPYFKEWKFYKKLSLWSNLLPTIPKKKAVNWLIKRYILWPLGFLLPDNQYFDLKELK